MTSIGFDPVVFVLMERLRTQAERERLCRRVRHVRRDRPDRMWGPTPSRNRRGSAGRVAR